MIFLLHLIYLFRFINSQIQPKIIGGYAVYPPNKYPFTASLQFFGQHYCGGVLYRQDLVITAAHCSDVDPRQVEVVSRLYNLTLPDSQQGAKRSKVKSINKHPQYNPDTYYNDIAVWKLSTYSSRNLNIYLDTYGISYYDNTPLKVVGWGALQEKGAASPVLMEANVPVFNSNTCVNNYKKINYTIVPQYTLCAGYAVGGVDSCTGDSGGPLFYPSKYGNYLVGIVSVGSGCAKKDLPGIYTRIYNYNNFINSYL
ncbi:putative trypsin-like serine protease precursor [Neoconidiobolus thromboides FSU 785]|nr:putative trypsin-like serine protease precursor [Neoconidiobolus thromboides FSU 785]